MIFNLFISIYIILGLLECLGILSVQINRISAPIGPWKSWLQEFSFVRLKRQEMKERTNYRFSTVLHYITEKIN